MIPLALNRKISLNSLLAQQKSIFGIRKTLLILFLLITILIHVLFLRYHTRIIKLNHKNIGQIQHNPITITSSSRLTRDLNSTVEKPIKILIWNKYWDSKALWHKVFSQIIHGQCPETLRGNNCVFTMNRTELSASDAVLFHLIDLHRNGNYQLPSSDQVKTRSKGQLWIAMSYEPPFILNYIGFNSTRLNGIFNRTMSYRSDSDIIVRHGRFLALDKSTTTTTTSKTRSRLHGPFPRFVSNWIHSHDDSKLNRNYAVGKRRLVAWFASSHGCKSQSGRERYVRQLQRWIDVDVYGSCGTYKCGVQKTLRNPYKVEHDDCYFLVSTGYKFVLAFENSICEDYITEKLYNNLMLNVIPIVLGGGNYTIAAPPNSVIDASKFSPKELASYLKLLNSNDTLYNEYFEWKKDYFIEAYDGIPMACELCVKLNDESWRSQPRVYQHFDEWLIGNCSKGF